MSSVYSHGPSFFSFFFFFIATLLSEQHIQTCPGRTRSNKELKVLTDIKLLVISQKKKTSV